MSGEKIADSLSLEDARRVIDAAVAKAVEIGVPQDVAVVDTGGHLKAHVR
ncbi:MAG TPA: heme-binding protein, partial [Micropruina sp.]|nr:heme-binding protein [Micropruina sp.]